MSGTAKITQYEKKNVRSNHAPVRLHKVDCTAQRLRPLDFRERKRKMHEYVKVIVIAT